ncbi:MAG: glycosyltransferase [Candidatus Nanopelagicales bacterium]
MPKCKVIDPAYTWGRDRRVATPWEKTIVYEAHVRGISMRHPAVPDAARGTFAGLMNDDLLGHIKDLGVTAIELLPIHAFVNDQHLLQKGLNNYWGYNSIAFFAPHPRYLAKGKIAEFKEMVAHLHDAGLEPLYAPHGIDTDQYRPLDQHTCRDELKVPADAFVVGMVAANKGYPSRKGWSQAILAFAEFARHHDDALLFLHTEMSVNTGGTDLVALLQSCGLGPERVICTNPYMQIVGSDVQHMAKLYSALDVLLNPSLGEGFGVPVVEAQACGRPVIVTDHTAMTELCGSGWLVEGDRVFTDQRSWMKIPQVGSIVEALEAAYQESRSPVVRDRAREFALAYDHRAVYDTYWRPVLAELEGRMVPLELPGTNGHVELEEVAA